MRFRRHLELERGQKEINITPLVDMVFLLLIFFMLTSSYINVPGIKVNLPKAVTSEAFKQQTVVIAITRDDTLYLNEKPISTEELESYLAEQVTEHQMKPLLIKADKDIRLEQVVSVWDLCRKAGVAEISIATVQTGG